MGPIIFFLEDRPKLQSKLIQNLNSMNIDFELGELNTQHFSDEEMMADFITSIRNRQIFLVSSPNNSDKIMMLNLAIDAAKRAGAKEIIPILTYYPYGRSDKKDQPRGAVGGKIIAEMLENRGATSVILFDLHADQTQGFFNIPVVHMEGKYVFDEIIADIYDDFNGEVVLCSPDAGAAKRVKGFRDRVKDVFEYNIPIVMIDKTRKEANVVDEMVLIGDVKDKNVIIIDDMADTCGTLCKATDHLLDMGAKSVRAIVTHGVLSGLALSRLYKSKLETFICTDSLPIENYFISDYLRVKTSEIVNEVSLSKQMALAIRGVSENVSIEFLKIGI